MEDVIRRRYMLTLIAGAAAGLSGCAHVEGEGAPDIDGDDTEAPNGYEGNESDDDRDDPDDDETDVDDEDTDPNDQSDEDQNDEDTDSEGSSAADIERATIDYGEAIGAFDEWEGSGGSYISVDESEALTDEGALYAELFSSTHATVGYDFPNGFDMGDRHLSTAVKVDAPRGGQLEVRMRAPSRSERVIYSRELPSDVDDWIRVDLGITRAKGSPEYDNINSLRLTLKGNEETDVSYWIDDLRATENPGGSYAILAFYGGSISHYEEAFPILEERGFPAAAAVSPTAIGSDGRMTLDQLRELRDAGWDICSHPSRAGPLPELEPDEQRSIIENEKEHLEEVGFESGARHFFAPRNRMDVDTIDIVRDVHETGFTYGASSAGMPPTAPHTLPVINGEKYDSSRSVILRADRHDQLVVLAFDEIGPEGIEPDTFRDQLDRIESNEYAGGLNVITPSDLADDHL